MEIHIAKSALSQASGKARPARSRGGQVHGRAFRQIVNQPSFNDQLHWALPGEDGDGCILRLRRNVSPHFGPLSEKEIQPSRAMTAVWQRHRKSGRSVPILMHMTRLCTGASRLVAPSPAAMSHSSRRCLRIVTAFAGIAGASPAPCSGPSWCRAPPVVRAPSPSSPRRPRHIDGSLSCSRGRATRRSR